MALFTVQTASEAGKLSGEARRAKSKQSFVPFQTTQDHADARAELESQMASIDRILRNPKLEAKDWRDLTMARRQIFQQWQVLANIPNPGNLKPTKPRSSRPNNGPEVEPTPQ